VEAGMNHLQLMSRTIDDFRNFFNPDEEKVTFFIKDAIESVMDIIGPTLVSSNIEVTFNIDENIILKCYYNEYKQVILNILSNAKDALVNNHIMNPRILIKAFQKDEKTILAISNNAGRISDNIIEKIFDPYFTTKVDGTGLGLYMSKIIIEKNMKGILEGINISDGAEFRITL
jgi:C4-dicarboxylate-specific signal transduction histidine kinase